MLPKEYRLPAKEIPEIARKGKRLAGEFMDIKAWYATTLEHPQFAISISKKIDKRAVVRNLIRRKLRAAILEILRLQNIPPGKYLILVKSDELRKKTVKMLGSHLLDALHPASS
jgi:ribonuclease P protein component